MAFAEPSLLSLSAAGLYLVVLLACLLAAFSAARYRQPPAHRVIWVGVAIVFVLLAVMRVTALEDIIRENLREMLRADQGYDQRRSIQRPLAVFVLFVVGTALAWALVHRWRAARGRRNMAVFIALAAISAMIVLVGLRIVSLHQIDGLLYGAVKLNWIIDIGASLTVLAAAGFYARLVAQRP
jgi:cation transport ATPase